MIHPLRLPLLGSLLAGLLFVKSTDAHNIDLSTASVCNRDGGRGDA